MKKRIAFLLTLAVCAALLLGTLTFAAADGTATEFIDFASWEMTDNVAGASLTNSSGTTLFAADGARTGVKFSGTGNSEIAVEQACSGAFETTFRVWSQVSGDHSKTAENQQPDMQEVEIVFDNGTDSFSVHVEPTYTWSNPLCVVPKASVSVNGGAHRYANNYNYSWEPAQYAAGGYYYQDGGTPLFGSGFMNVTRYGSGNLQTCYPTTLKFDPATMTVSARLYTKSTGANYDAVVWKLDTNPGTFIGDTQPAEVALLDAFDGDYTVTFKLTAVDGHTGNFLLYSLNNADVAGHTDRVAVSVSQQQQVYGRDLMAGDRYVLPAPRVNGTTLDCAVTATVDGNAAAIGGLNEDRYADGCYIDTVAGDYTVTYTPAAGSAVKKPFDITFSVESALTPSDKTFAEIMTASGVTAADRSAKANTLTDGSDNVLFPDDDTHGVTLTTDSTGTVRFDKLAGAFETSFRVWADTTMSSGEFGNFADTHAYDLRELKITLDDGENRIHLYISAGDEWKAIVPTARVQLNDGDKLAYQYNDQNGNFNAYRANHYGSWLFGTSFVNKARGFGTWLDPARTAAFRVGFDPATMQVYGYAVANDNRTLKKYVVWDLSQAPSNFAGAAPTQPVPTLSAFGKSYSVTYTLTAESGKTGKLSLYSINGQVMRTNSAGKIFNTAGAEITQTAAMPIGAVGQLYELPAFHTTDVLDGELAFAGTVAVTDAAGEPVELTGLTAGGAYQEGCGFTPTAAGTYTVAYTPADAQGMTGTAVSANVFVYSGATADLSDKTYADIWTATGVTASERSAAASTLTDAGGRLLFPQEKASGAVLTTDATGTVKFDTLAGAFETSFRVWTDTTMSTTDAWKNYADYHGYDLREVKITLDDGLQQIHIYIAGGDEWKAVMPTVRVQVNDGDKLSIQYDENTGARKSYRANSYGTSLFGASFVNQGRGFGAWIPADKTPAIRIGFDPATMQIYGYGLDTDNETLKKYIVWDLTQAPNSFSGPAPTQPIPTLQSFGANYSVTYTLTAESGKTGKLLLYAVNGQEMQTDYAGKIVNTAGARLANKTLVLPGEVGQSYALPMPRTVDVLDGARDFAGTVAVTDAAGEPVELTGLAADGAYQEGCGFTPTAAGTYTVTYTPVDEQGAVGDETSVTVTVTAATTYPEPGTGGNVPEPVDPPAPPSEEKPEPESPEPDEPAVTPAEGKKKGCGCNAAALGLIPAAVFACLLAGKKRPF